jgi:hypothetical protein
VLLDNELRSLIKLEVLAQTGKMAQDEEKKEGRAKMEQK